MNANSISQIIISMTQLSRLAISSCQEREPTYRKTLTNTVLWYERSILRVKSKPWGGTIEGIWILQNRPIFPNYSPLIITIKVFAYKHNVAYFRETTALDQTCVPASIVVNEMLTRDDSNSKTLTDLIVT